MYNYNNIIFVYSMNFFFVSDIIKCLSKKMAKNRVFYFLKKRVTPYIKGDEQQRFV